VQAEWWTELARMLNLNRDARAVAAARHALALCESLQQPERSLRAAAVWVRSFTQPGPELDEACAGLRARVAAMSDLPARQRLVAHGALVRAALVNRDYPAVLAGRLAELALASDLGDQAIIDATESNVVSALNAMGHHAEAAERGRALLARIDRTSGETNGNLPWVFGGLLEALVYLGRLDEAQALAKRAWAARQRFGTPEVGSPLALLAAGQQRFMAAARLVGYTLQSCAASRLTLEATDESLLQRARAAASAALGPAQTETLIEEGRSLSDEAAGGLAAGNEP
jgi:hypothetical protein